MPGANESNVSVITPGTVLDCRPAASMERTTSARAGVPGPGDP